MHRYALFALLGSASLSGEFASATTWEMFSVPDAPRSSEAKPSPNVLNETPVSIEQSLPLELPEIYRPSNSLCRYTLGPDGPLGVSGEPECGIADGIASPASFSLRCEASRLMRISLTYQSEIEDGLEVGAGQNALSIDHAAPAGDTQLALCDTDGISALSAGIEITLYPDAPSDFSGRIATIQLEVIYD